MSVQLRINHAGRLYDNGRSLPQFIRERVLDLHHEGVSQRHRTRTKSKSALRPKRYSRLRCYKLLLSAYEKSQRVLHSNTKCHRVYRERNETEIVIYEACSRISQENSISYFRQCGYLLNVEDPEKNV